MNPVTEVAHLSERDLEQLKARGISPAEVEQQLAYFRNGFPPLHLIRAATVGDGIRRLDESAIQELISSYEKALPDKR